MPKLLMRFQLPSIAKIPRPTVRRRSAVVPAIVVLAALVACAAATATPAPSPRFTTEPAPTSIAAPALTSSPQHVNLEAGEVDAFALLKEFLAELGPRESATEQELAAAQYLQSRFQEFGYATNLQTFTVEAISLAGLGLTINTFQPREFTALPLLRTGLGEVSGVLTPVALAMPGDLPDAGLEGRIALAKRGVIRFQSKAEKVFAAGAVGLVVYNNVSGLFQGVLET